MYRCFDSADDFETKRGKQKDAIPETFVKAPNGSYDFGQITIKERQSGKIRLQIGRHLGGNNGYGLTHINAEHPELIDPVKFVSNVTSGYEEIWKTRAGRLMLVKNDNDIGGMVSIVQLTQHDEGDFYSVVTAFKSRKPKGETLLWSDAHSHSADPGINLPSALDDSKTSATRDDAKQKEADTSIAEEPKNSIGKVTYDAATSEVLFRNKRVEQKERIAVLGSKGFMSPSEIRREDYKEKLRYYGITDPDALEDLAPVEQNDYVTGFHLASDKAPTVQYAQAYIEETGKTAHYVEADISNLGGLNTYFHNDHTPANAVYRSITDIFAQEVTKAGETAVHIRHGGDEFGSVVIGATPESIEQAQKNIKERVTQYVQEQGLHEIPHPKHPDNDAYKGVSIYLGSSPILPGKELNHIFEQSSRVLDLGKLGLKK